MRFLGMFQLNVYAEYLIEYFSGFLLRLLSIGFGLFNTDDLTALGTFAEEMTGAIHFVPGAKPTHVGQFWFLHAPSFPLAEPFSYPCGNQTDPLPNLHGGCRERGEPRTEKEFPHSTNPAVENSRYHLQPTVNERYGLVTTVELHQREYNSLGVEALMR